MTAPLAAPQSTLGNARLWALVPCAGSGSRAAGGGSEPALPKQYQPLAGQPLVLHTLQAFAVVSRLQGLLLAVAPGDRFMDAHPGPWQVRACGGDTRAATVAQGLQALRELGAVDADWVLVHDAARCLVTPVLIEQLIDACLHDPVGGLLALPLSDTLKSEQDGRVAQTLPRAHKWLAQTPQMFRLGVLQQALQRAGDSVTDEASAIEALGLAPRLVQGSSLNFKLTWPQDFRIAQALLAAGDDALSPTERPQP